MSTGTPSQAPFPPSHALDKSRLSAHPEANHRDVSSQLEGETKAGHLSYVPGNPAVNLLPEEVRVYVSNELDTPLLDELYDRLWLVARKSYLNVDALHKQRIKGRTIIPAEDPRLHLVWNQDKIYVKPVPVFLFNHDFWTIYLQPMRREPASTDPRSVAIGFLRSYALLVKSQLDFAIAKESYLIPEDVDWIQFSKFISYFRRIGDRDVAKRYHFGQLRLTRLNWAVRILRPKHASTKWFYEIPHWSASEFVARATLPLVFLFASVSLTLSSMQVALAAPADGQADGQWLPGGLGQYGLRKMSLAFGGFSIAAVLLWIVTWTLLLGIPLVAFIWQLLWGFRHREKKLPT